LNIRFIRFARLAHFYFILIVNKMRRKSFYSYLTRSIII